MYGKQKEKATLKIIEKRIIAFAVAAAVIIAGFAGMLINKSGSISGRDRALNYSVEFEGRNV